jgi:hypothetical protein
MKYAYWIAIILVVFVASWKMLDPEITNVIFQDELQDTAAELDSRIGLATPKSDNELCNVIIRKAAKHDIELDPKQVMVRSSGPPEHRVIYIVVHYSIPVNLLVYSYRLHYSYERRIRQKPLPNH